MYGDDESDAKDDGNGRTYDELGEVSAGRPYETLELLFNAPG